MTAKTRSYLYGQFSTGDRPTQTDFADLVDSFVRAASVGNALIGTETEPTSGSPGVVVMAQLSSSAANPSLSADTGAIFVKSVSGTAEVFTIDEAGNATQQTSHSWTLFDPHPDHEYPFVYRAENEHLGLLLEVDMYGAIRAIENLSRQKFIYLQQTDKREWDSPKPMPGWMQNRIAPRAEMIVQLSWRQRLRRFYKRPFKWLNRVWIELVTD